jgi:hypothetical protein
LKEDERRPGNRPKRRQSDLKVNVSQNNDEAKWEAKGVELGWLGGGRRGCRDMQSNIWTHRVLPSSFLSQKPNGSIPSWMLEAIVTDPTA